MIIFIIIIIIIILSGVVCSLLNRADKASSALSLMVKKQKQNNDGYPGEADNWLYMKLLAIRSFETGWIQSVICTKRQSKSYNFHTNFVLTCRLFGSHCSLIFL